MKMKSILAIVLAALFVAACSSSAPTAQAAATDTASSTAVMEATIPADNQAAATDTTAAGTDLQVTVSFSQDVWPILEQYAVAAHGGKGGVFLESYSDIMNYVVPGDPENSMLYKALIGDGVDRMPPPPADPLPDAMIQTIYDWIAQGALDN